MNLMLGDLLLNLYFSVFFLFVLFIIITTTTIITIAFILLLLFVWFEQNYTILSEADIRQLQEEDITTVSTVLSMSRIHASILLRHYNW